jgi:biopolymer transport protein ExbD
MRRTSAQATTGLEAAPDIMLLTMAALMVAIVWLVAHASEATLPPIELPQSDAAALGASDAASLHVTLRPGETATLVWLDDAELEGGLDALEAALHGREAAAMTLRADARVPWQDALRAMSAGARSGLSLSIAAES